MWFCNIDGENEHVAVKSDNSGYGKGRLDRKIRLTIPSS